MQFGYCFRISELLLCVHAEEKLTVPKAFRPFLSAGEDPENADIRISVRFYGGTCPGEEAGTLLRSTAYREGSPIELRETPGKAGSYALLVPEAFRKGFCENGRWLQLIPMEKLLLPHARLLLHGALVEFEGRAYCFIAPSGGGKSTHAALWQKCFRAKLLNGDKALIHAAGTPMAYGSPIAGSSGIFINEGAPLGAVYVLTKAAEDACEMLAPRAAAMALYAAAVKDEKDAAFNGRILDEVVKLQQKAPVISLRCTLGESAAKTALHFIKERK